MERLDWKKIPLSRFVQIIYMEKEAFSLGPMGMG